MRGVGVPTGLQALLQKLGLMAKGAAAAGANAQAMKGEGAPPAAARGAQLGADGLLRTGMGYDLGDKRSGLTNAAERASVARFLDSGGPPARRSPIPSEPGPERRAEGPIHEREQAPPPGPEEARVVGHAEIAEAETERLAEEPVPEPGSQERRRDDSEDDDKPGAGWVAEDFEDGDEERTEPLRAGDPLGEGHRCRGLLADGSRCLRRPTRGTPYCPEHAAG